MKKVILTLTAGFISLMGFSHDIMFDDFLKKHDELGPRLSTISCEIEELTHKILHAETLEEQQVYAIKIREVGGALKDDIGKLRKKNAVSCNDYTIGPALAVASGNVALAYAYAGLWQTEELPKSKYYSYLEDIMHYAWRIKVANKEDKAELKANEILEVVSNYNLYHAEVKE